MSRLVWSLFVCALVVAAHGYGEEAKKDEVKKEELKKIDVKSDKDKASYYAGMNMAESLKGFIGNLDSATLSDSLIANIEGKASKMQPAESEKLVDSFRAFLKATQEAGASGGKTAPPVLADKDNVSYAIGQDIGGNIKPMIEYIDIALFKAGFVSAIKGEKVDFKPEEHQEAFARYTKTVQAAQDQHAIKEESDFLAENGKKEGVVTTASGLQYKILKAGTGEKASGNDKVSVHYEGRLPNGKVFDSSIKRNEPFETGVNGGVIEGWLEALKLMPVGSKWELYIPSKLAYKDTGAPPDIPGHAALIFTLEILSIQKAK